MDSPALATRMMLHVSSDTDLESLDGRESGAVADLFCDKGLSSLRPVHVAEKFHPMDVLFRIDAHSPLLKDGLREMAKLGHMGYDNICVLFSGVRDLNDLYRTRMIFGEAGLSVNARFGLIVESPSLAMLHEEALKKGPSSMVADIDALEKQMLGSSGPVRHTGIHPSVLKAAAGIGGSCRRMGVPFGVSGNILSERGAVEQLVRQGVDFFIASGDRIPALKNMAFHAEKKHELDFLKSKIRMSLKSRRI